MDENRLAIKAFSKLDQFLDGALDEKLKSSIRNRAIVGGVCMAIPLWGIETIVYFIVLWGMYSEVAKISTVPFKDHLLQNIGGAVVVNILVALFFGFLLDFFSVLGWIMSFVVGYASITLSGLAYIKTLKAIHGRKSHSTINFQRGYESMKKNSGFSHQTSSFINKAKEYVDIPVDPILTQSSNETHTTNRLPYSRDQLKWIIAQCEMRESESIREDDCIQLDLDTLKYRLESNFDILISKTKLAGANTYRGMIFTLQQYATSTRKHVIV